MNKVSALSLLSNAALVWNTVRIGKVVADLEKACETVTCDELARISPLMFRHIIPNGTYSFDRELPGDSSLTQLAAS